MLLTSKANIARAKEFVRSCPVNSLHDEAHINSILEVGSYVYVSITKINWLVMFGKQTLFFLKIK
jgi:hypothetical protein